MYDGMINIYKEKGYTSHDVVARLRGILHQKKIGHTGTLDPDATGVLPVCLGKGTRLCEMLTDHDKTYVAEMLLGQVTDTQDIWGKILQVCEVDVSEQTVKEAVKRFVGEFMQVPPMYSAIKIDGKKLYELARAGKEVERQARKVMIYSLNILEMKLPYVKMEVCCSKGTYIRTLCHDIGESLGYGACMSSLVRTKVGKFGIDGSLKLDEVEALAANGEEAVKKLVISVEEMLSEYETVRTKDAVADKMLLNGNQLGLHQLRERDEAKFRQAENGKMVRVYTKDDHFVAVYSYDATSGYLKSEKMFI